MRALSENWVDAFERGCRPVWIVRLQHGPTILEYVSGSLSMFGLEPVIDDVSLTGAKIDPVSREVSLGRLLVRFERPGFEGIPRTYNLKGWDVSAWLGATELGRDDFEIMFTGAVEEVLPTAGTIELQVADPRALVKEQRITGNWIALHPLEILSDIIFNKCSLDTSRCDPAPLQVGDPRNRAIGHWNLSRYQGGTERTDQKAIVTPVSARELIAGLCALLNGSFIPPTGTRRFKLRRFDKNAPAVKHFTREEVVDFEQPTNLSNLVNQVVINYDPVTTKHHWIRNGVTRDFESPASSAFHEINDEWSQQQHGVWPAQISSDWLVPASYLDAALAPAFETEMSVPHAVMAGMVGAGSLGLSDPAAWPLLGGVPRNRQLGAQGRRGYLKVDDEIIEVDGLTEYGDGTWYDEWWDPKDDPNVVGTPIWHYSLFGTYSISNRGMFGTTPAEHVRGAPVLDLTIPIMMALDLLDRCRNGAPTVRFRVPPKHADLELMDCFTLEHETFIAAGLTSFGTHSIVESDLDSRWVFEATLVEPRSGRDSPGVVVEGAFVRKEYARG